MLAIPGDVPRPLTLLLGASLEKQSLSLKRRGVTQSPSDESSYATNS